MRKPHDLGATNLLGKRLAPLLTRLLMRPGGVRRLLPLVEAYVAILQGKGAGTGWDMDGEVRAAVAHLRRNRGVLFDVGANLGAWSRGMLSLLDAQNWQVYQFEPSAYCCSILREQDSANTTVIQAAVGNRSGQATLLSPERGSPIASLYVRRDSYHQVETEPVVEPVTLVTIDDILQTHGIELVDFMKVDVEGHELAVLEGAAAALAAGRIRAFSFEFGSGNLNARSYFHDFWDLLHPLGYAIQRIAPGGMLIPIEEYYEDLEYFRGVSNYVAAAPQIVYNP